LYIIYAEELKFAVIGQKLLAFSASRHTENKDLFVTRQFCNWEYYLEDTHILRTRPFCWVGGRTVVFIGFPDGCRKQKTAEFLRISFSRRFP
jgi:hypothetical protein